MSTTQATVESPTKMQKKRNVVTVTKDFDIEKRRFVDIDEPFEIDQDDLRIVDEIIRLQKEHMEEGRGCDAESFLGRKKLVEIGMDDKDRRVRRLELSHNMNALPQLITNFDALEILNLERADYMDAIPPWIGEFKNLKKLYLPETVVFTEFPEELWNLTKLEFFTCRPREKLLADFDEDGNAVDVFGNIIPMDDVSIPESIGKLKNLKQLYLAQVNFLPHEIEELSCLQRLVLNNYKIALLPTSIGKLQKLKELNIANSEKLRRLPESFGELHNLQWLAIQNVPKLRSMPKSFCELTNLQTLLIGGMMSLRSLPDSFGELSNLRVLQIEEVPQLHSLPESFGKLTNLKELDISEAENLRSLPESFGDLKNLETLIIHQSAMNSLPRSMVNLPRLKYLHLTFNENLKKSLDSLGAIRTLKVLKLDGTKIESFPRNLCNLPNLEHLDLRAAENLKRLPDEIGNLTNLRFLGLAETKIELLPDFEQRRKLKNLRYLTLNGTSFESSKDTLLKLTKEFPLLGCLGDIEYEITPVENAIFYNLNLNRARAKVFFGNRTESDELAHVPLSLWPLILSKDGGDFSHFAFDGHDNVECSCCEQFEEQQDFIYRFLVEFVAKSVHSGSPSTPKSTRKIAQQESPKSIQFTHHVQY